MPVSTFWGDTTKGESVVSIGEVRPAQVLAFSVVSTKFEVFAPDHLRYYCTWSIIWLDLPTNTILTRLYLSLRCSKRSTGQR